MVEEGWFWTETFTMIMDCFYSKLFADFGYWLDKHEDNTFQTSSTVSYPVHHIF